MDIETRRLGGTFGAEVNGVDLSASLDAETFDALYQLWLEHKVLLFRNQAIDDDALVRFSEHFGVLDLSPSSADESRGAQAKSRPEIWIISNVKEKGVPIGALGDKEAEWHTDMSYVAEPPKASVLYSLEIPEEGGNTSFADMVAALEELPHDLRAEIDGRLANHDSSYTSVGELRVDAKPVSDVREAPGARHPIIRRHPETGELALYLGRRKNAYICGLDLAASEALLDALWAHCTQPKYALEHRWQLGDLLIWDNRVVIHKREAFDPHSRRVMHRTQIKGEKPLAA